MTSFIKSDNFYLEEICLICRDPLIEDVWAHDVHRFHGRCIAEWVQVNPSCPTCRVAVDTTALIGFKLLINREEAARFVNWRVRNVVAIVFAFCWLPAIYEFSVQPERCVVELIKKIAPGFFIILGNALMLAVT